MFTCLGESSKIKIGKPHRDPLVSTEKEGKKIANKDPKTDAKVTDYGDKEKEKLSSAVKENNGYPKKLAISSRIPYSSVKEK